MKPKHTIIVVPSERARPKKFRVSNLQIGLVSAGLAALTLGAVVSFWAFLSAQVDRVQLSGLQQENERLRSSNSSFEARIETLQGRLSEFEDRTRKLAIVAGLENLGASGEAGIGGSAPQAGLPAAELAMATLESRSIGLADSMGRIEGQLLENLRLIAATPAIAPVRGIVTSDFGIRRDPMTGQRAFHSGVDISAPPGKPVKAAASGIVVKTDQSGGLGRAVYVSHGFGITTVYGHLSRIQAKQGDLIRRGEVIGLVGNTGRATGYHLHYEVQVSGRPVDPLGYILDGASSSF